MTHLRAPAPPPPLSLYRTQLQDASGTWQTGLDFGLGFTWDPERSIPQPVVQLAGQDVSLYVALSVNADRCLQIALDLTTVQDLVCALEAALYLKVSATLSADGQSLTGTVTALCSGAVSWAWRGQAELSART